MNAPVLDEQIIDVLSFAIGDAARALRLSPQTLLNRVIKDQTILLRALLHAYQRYSMLASSEPPLESIVIDDRPTPPTRSAPITPLLPGVSPRKPRG